MLFDVPVETEVVCSVEKDPLSSGLEEMSDKLFKRFADKHYSLIDELRDISFPKKGQQFRLITRRTFNSIQFIDLIAENEIIEQMTIVIYSINFNAAKILVGLVNSGRIKKLDVMMSNLRNKAYREKEEIVKNELTAHENITLFFCSSHAKIFTCRTDAGNYYTLEGSGNMAYNSRVEQYVIDNDKGLYDFTVSWVDSIKKFLHGKKELEVCSE